MGEAAGRGEGAGGGEVRGSGGWTGPRKECVSPCAQAPMMKGPGPRGSQSLDLTGGSAGPFGGHIALPGTAQCFH